MSDVRNFFFKFQKTAYAGTKIKNNYHYYCRLKAPYARPLGLNLPMNSDDFAMFPTLWLSLVNLNTLAGKLQALESEHLHHIVHHSNRPNLEKEWKKQLIKLAYFEPTAHLFALWVWVDFRACWRVRPLNMWKLYFVSIPAWCSKGQIVSCLEGHFLRVVLGRTLFRVW